MSRLSVDSTNDANDESRPSWADSSAAMEAEDIAAVERTHSRRRSLECSSVEISIVGTDLTKGHTLYIIQVLSGHKDWQVARRFRDFVYLDKQLRKSFPKLKIPPLPSKTYFSSSTEARVVDERRAQLETYLKSLIYMQSIWTRNDLVLFLNDDTNSMMFIWNFERMRKMQDMLSSMTVENEEETTKLNTDLSLARTQVHALQERLSRMEMILLQQATGMASEELSPSAIRSLSGMGMDRNQAARLLNEIDAESSHLYGDNLPTSPPRKGDAYGSASTEEEDLNPQERELIEEAVDAHVTSGEALPTSEIVQVLNMVPSPAQSKTMLKNLKGKTPEQMRTLAVSLQLQEALRISNEVLNEKFDINANSPRRSESSSNLSNLNRATLKTPPSFPLSAAENALFAYKAGSAAAAWVSTLDSEMGEIMQVLVPSAASIQARYKVFRYVRDLVSNTLGVQLFPIGSMVSHTYLPDGDIDASAFVTKNDDDSWFVKVNEALCMSSFAQSGNNHPGSKHSSFDTIPDPPDMIEAAQEDISISNVGFVNGDVKKIKIMINNISVDISMNQVGSLYAQYLIETVDKFVAQNHLFKKSMLLVEAWARYESPRYTQGGGSMIASAVAGAGARLSPWAVTVMLIWVFNSEGARITTPVQALGHFLRIFACFDWSKYALTVQGPVSATDLSVDETKPLGDRFFPVTLLEKFSQQEEEAPVPAAAVPEAEEESIMVGEVVVKIDTSIKVEGSSDASPTADSAAPAARPPLVRANSSTSSLPVGMVTEIGAVYEQGLINIIDPAGPNRNLVPSLDVEGYQVITSAMYEGYKQFQTMCEAFVKLQTAQGGESAQKLPEAEVMKIMKLFLINTQLKVIGWNSNFKRKPGNLSLAFGNPDTATVAVADPNVDTLLSQFDELEFSLRFAEIVLGGRINRAVLVQMIVRVLMHKGPMPVGEVGKNLQTMTGSDTLSKRLKEQFNGLKRAIEHSQSPRLKVGNEHPFNPIVQLVPEAVQPPSSGGSAEAEEEEQEPLVAPLAHHSFVFTPILAQAALLAREKEANAAASSNASVMSGKSSRTFRRQPPFYVDTMSISSRSHSQWSQDPRNNRGGKAHTSRVQAIKPGGSPRTQQMQMGGGMNYGGGNAGQGQNLPMHGGGYARMPAPMMLPQPGMGPMGGMVAGSYPPPLVMQMPMQVGGNGSMNMQGPGGVMAMPLGSPLSQGMPVPVYTQQMQQMQLHYMQQQQQIYQNYQAQMHPSLASSLSSSYGAGPGGNGAQSPMGSLGAHPHSPMAMYQQQNYMASVMGAQQQQQQQGPPQGQGQGQGQGGKSPQTSPTHAQGQPQQHW